MTAHMTLYRIRFLNTRSYAACTNEVGICFDPDDAEPFSEVELGVFAFVHPHVVHEVSVLHTPYGGDTWDLVPIMRPEDDYRAPAAPSFDLLRGLGQTS